MEEFVPSLLGTWTGCEQKHIYKSCPEGMESVTRKFTFTVEFLADCSLRGVLKHEDNDGEGSSRSVTGSWRVSGAGDTVVTVDQTVFVDTSDDEWGYDSDDQQGSVAVEKCKKPVAEIRIIKQGNVVIHVTVDNSNSRINHVSHCDDIHVIQCSRVV
jgi:hypothetical protein